MSRFDLPPSSLSTPEQSLQRLKKQAIAVALAHILGALALASLLSTFWPQSWVMIWAMVTTVALLHIWSLTWRNLDSHHPPEQEQLFPSLGPGNLLSLFRALLLACLAGFILLPWPPGGWAWLPALLYTLAGIIDYFDGYVARRSGFVSPLGEFLDIELDALGVLIVVSVAIHLGHLPVWFVIIGLARYLFMFGLSWRQRLHKPVYPLPPSVSRRVLAGLQMGFL
ncbi:MAG: CDP-alcohol phosphatidyltransferase family protein, partial [Chloroflexi bacterium]|nr:CDP-alcohol phosphatidyltransferase family protein [Chloroflexota bacterium]